MAGKHTPGPWALAFQRHQWAAVDSGSGFLTSPDHRAEQMPYEERLANARLMAAAPALADALEEVFTLITAGQLVRNTAYDGEAGYAIKAMATVMALKHADEALRAAGRLP